MLSKESIGLFDSGVGGTTIWKEIVELLPYENTLFLADNKNAPYGGKSKDEIIHLCENNTEFLLNHNVKIIVVACNTGTTTAISHLRDTYKQVPFIGVEPAVKPAALQSSTKKIGILATKGTLSSELFLKTSDNSARKNGVQVIERVGEGLVQLIEEGKINSPEMVSLLKSYLLPMVDENIDYLVLGCTHYPYLLPQIKQIIPSHIHVIDSGAAVARQTQKVLQEFFLLNPSQANPQHLWYANGDVTILKQLASPFKNVTLESIGNGQ